MSKNSTTRTTDNTQGTTQGSAVTQANANQIMNLGFRNVNTANPGYQGELTAGLTPDQLAAFSMIRQGVNAGQPQLQAASNFATAAGGYTPDQVMAGQAQVAQAGATPGVDMGAVNSLFSSSGGGSASAGPAASARDVSTRMLTDVNLGGYMNPFQKDVIDSSLASIKQAQGIENARLAGMQAKGAAFGDSRSGVESALTNQLFDQNRSGTIANLNSANFMNAQQQAQADLARQLEAERSNQGADVSTSIANTQAGTQANIANAGNRTSFANTGVGALIENARLAQSGNQFNVSEMNKGNQFNTELQAKIAQGNQTAGLDANGQRITAAGALGGLGMSTQEQMLNAANAQGAAGGVAQGTNQAAMTAQLDNYLRNQGFDQQQIDNLIRMFSATSPATGMRTTSSTQSTAVKPGSLIPGLIGAASFIPGIGTALGGAMNALSGGIGKPAK